MQSITPLVVFVWFSLTSTQRNNDLRQKVILSENRRLTKEDVYASTEDTMILTEGLFVFLESGALLGLYSLS